MSTHDLREALETHAQFDDTAALARLGSVKHRVRVVRRRRRATIAGAAAAVVLAGSGAAMLLPGDGSADRQFASMTAPTSMTSLGYTYTFDRLVTGDGTAKLADPPKVPYLLSWAGAGTAPVTIDGPEDNPFLSKADFSDFVVVPEDGGQAMKATGPGKVALAVYTLADRPAGNTAGGITFRDERAGDRLIDSVLGSAGDNDLSFTFTMPQRPIAEVSICSGAGRDYDVHVSLNGHLTSGSQCFDQPNYDAQSNRSTWDGGIAWPDGTKLEPGDEVTARIWLTRHDKSLDTDAPVATSSSARLGLAYYEVAPTVAEVAGWHLPELYEFGGHTYRYISSEEHRGGQASYQLTVADGDPESMVQVVTRSSNENVLWTVKGNGEEGRHSGGSFTTEVGPIREGSASVSVKRGRAGGVDDTIGFARYERID